MDEKIPNKQSITKQQRALDMLQNAAEQISPQMLFNEILNLTVQLASGLMDTFGNPNRYFSHIAVKEWDRVYFDPEHNLPEVQSMLRTSLGERLEISFKGERVGITGRVAITGIATLVHNVRENNDYIDLKKNQSQKTISGSQISVPIKIGGEVVAVLNIEHQDTFAFSDEDFQTMKALASIVGLVISYKESDTVQKVFYKAAMALNTIRTDSVSGLGQILQVIADQAYELMNVRVTRPSTGFTHVALKQGNLLHYVAAHPPKMLTLFREQGYDPVNLKREREPNSIGISGRAAVSGETLNVRFAVEHRDFLRVDRNETQQKEETGSINSQLAVPFKVDGKVVGVISIDHPASSGFTVEDEKNVTLLAEIAAEACRSAGVVEYIVHPQDPQALDAKISALVRLKESLIPAKTSEASFCRVFISYSRKDSEFADKLALEMSRLGFDVWIDRKDIGVGEKWSVAIEGALSICDAMVVIISPDSMSSNLVSAEWMHFLEVDKPLIPILYKPTKVPFLLKGIQYIDCTKESNTWLVELEQVLRKLAC